MPPDPALVQAPHPAAAPGLAETWRTPLAALVAACLALVLVTAREWGEMLHQWWNIDTYNHLLLVPFVIAWLVMLKTDELARIVPRAFLPGVLACLAALGLWGAGRVSGINLFAHAGAVGALIAAVPAVLGARAALLLALPLAMGAFMVPFGDEIIPPLQTITAEIAIALTRASGVPATLDGINIATPAGLFIVAEACSGVKFLVAMVTLGVLVAFTRFSSWRRRVLFLAACILVPILANGMRAFATIYVAQYVGAEKATGFDHIVYGWLFFALVVAVLIGGAWRFFEREPGAHGWSAESLARWDWLARVEGQGAAPMVAALAITGIAAIAALAVMI